jgi:hypothetical protein
MTYWYPDLRRRSHRLSLAGVYCSVSYLPALAIRTEPVLSVADNRSASVDSKTRDHAMMSDRAGRLLKVYIL